ncbi:GGDEF domain-containing protein [Leptospira perolatii]|uniref:diguanylate cyclase n=1 Tax=Leptospira perolatii TaxID=2023191 RepID=A0A2M9ZR54_9LEPT|nr:GGDEF domain-containing protein [Leptospira perolatii]PJZ69064.1 GGDEF domain-containing protein [Leptospira perolatii]PJZ74449.1 GGDEF domain-containing protein [Leptospira perolatii]
MIQWLFGRDTALRYLSKQILFYRYPQDFLKRNFKEIRGSLFLHYSFCILISLASFLIPNTKAQSGDTQLFLHASRFTLVLLSLLFLKLTSRKKNWIPEKMEWFKVWTSSVLLISFIPYLYFDFSHYEIYLHQATAILLSMNLILWLTPTTSLVTNFVFSLTFFAVCFLPNSDRDALKEFPILFTYIFVGSFGNIIMNYWRMMDYRDKKKLSRVVSHLRWKNIQIQKVSSVDDLTGLYNRRYLIEQYDVFKKRAQRYKFNMALIILDLDHLKEINDQHGHIVGDEALHTLGAVMKSRVRATDICARIGGDEFCILLDSVEPKSFRSLCESLRKGIENQPLSVSKPNRPVKITASIGATILAPNEDFGFDDLYQSIDSALYRSKGEGRNKVTIIEATKHDPARRILTSWAEEVRIYK